MMVLLVPALWLLFREIMELPLVQSSHRAGISAHGERSCPDLIWIAEEKDRKNGKQRRFLHG